ncbi:MAG: DUF1778 domain-containing protein [Pseudonocardia sp.]
MGSYCNSWEPSAATDRTLTDFVLDSAVIEAERVLADRRWFPHQRRALGRVPSAYWNGPLATCRSSLKVDDWLRRYSWPVRDTPAGSIWAARGAGVRGIERVRRVRLLVDLWEPSAVLCAVPGSQPVITAPPEPWPPVKISIPVRGVARDAVLCSRSTIIRLAA